MWKKRARDEMLEWFESLSDRKLGTAWVVSRDRLEPGTSDDNFICRSCRHNVPGIMCRIGKSYQNCEDEVTANPSAWSSRGKDEVIGEGSEAYRLYNERCACKRCRDASGVGQCPYPAGSEKAVKWMTGWEEEKHFFEVEAENG